jgi:hypothetical protein
MNKTQKNAVFYCTLLAVFFSGISVIVLSLSLNDYTSEKCTVAGTNVIISPENSTVLWCVFAFANVFTPNTRINTDAGQLANAIVAYNVTSVHTCFYNSRTQKLTYKDPAITAALRLRKKIYAASLFLSIVSFLISLFFLASVRRVSVETTSGPIELEPIYSQPSYNAESIDNFSNASAEDDDIVFFSK